MSSNDAFRPVGPTVLVDTTERQVSNTGGTRTAQYRVRNLGAASAWFAWSPDLGPGVTPSITVTAPVAGTPSANTMGMLATSCEVFTLPQNAWFKASAGATFEVTPGDGL